MQYNPEDLRPHRYGCREQDLRVIGRRSLSRALAEKMFSESSERTFRRLRGGGQGRSIVVPVGRAGSLRPEIRKNMVNPELRKPYEEE